MRVGGPWSKFQCDRDHLAPEIGGHGGSERVAPPWIADQLLTGSGQTDERLYVPWVVGQRGQVPSLCLRSEVWPQLSIEGSRRAGKTLVEVVTGAQFAHDSSNFLLEKQNMQLSRNPPDDFGLRWYGLVGAKFEATGPKILGGRRIGDPDIDTQHPGTSALGAARYKYLTSDSGCSAGLAGSLAKGRNEKPRPCRVRSAARSLVNASRRSSWSASPVRLRNRATPTAMLDSKHGHGIAARSALGAPNAPPSRRRDDRAGRYRAAVVYSAAREFFV